VGGGVRREHAHHAPKPALPHLQQLRVVHERVVQVVVVGAALQQQLLGCAILPAHTVPSARPDFAAVAVTVAVAVTGVLAADVLLPVHGAAGHAAVAVVALARRRRPPSRDRAWRGRHAAGDGAAMAALHRGVRDRVHRELVDDCGEQVAPHRRP
jgi:hypothetical protein